MSKIEEVAFIPIGTRLASRVLQIQNNEDIIIATHEQLASDLGTSREVISRKLAQWEQQGIIKRGRGSLRIINMAKIQRMAGTKG